MHLFRPGNDAEAGVLDQKFDTAALAGLREAVLGYATACGMPEDRAIDVMLAVHELAANAVRHGPGHGQLRLHVTASTLRCEVTRSARQTEPSHSTMQSHSRTRQSSNCRMPKQFSTSCWLRGPMTRRGTSSGPGSTPPWRLHWEPVAILAALIAPTIALMTLATLGLSGAPFHDPFHARVPRVLHVATVRNITEGIASAPVSGPTVMGPTVLDHYS